MVKARALTATGACLLVVACASLPRNPVPAALVEQAQPIGFENTRFWGDERPKNIDQIIKANVAQLRAKQPELFRSGKPLVTNHLAISGGGSDGAFGAGLLVGWSKQGTRPEFQIVTGVSAGALTAPFAFLGRTQDAALKQVFTQYSSRDFVRRRIVAGVLGGAALADSQPLANVIAQYADMAFLEAIAREHESGRRLLIGTTNLDAQRPVIWDMGAIATRRSPEALTLFRQILLASASIPGVFPPVRIQVRAGGQVREELHVDGGTTSQVFLFPSQIMLKTYDRRYGIEVRRRLYVIRNGRLSPEHKVVKAETLAIAGRSISTLIKNQGIGDLYRLHATARRNGFTYRQASIPKDFKDTSEEPFDRAYMNALFDLGYQLGKTGYRWAKAPPGFGG
ncbi:MAG: patatin-like phospholipase family protein [Hyphomicrobiales bacterium]|nr:patatin-like phospholipase family protein [Hyphomicrobiales bacterium]